MSQAAKELRKSVLCILIITLRQRDQIHSRSRDGVMQHVGEIRENEKEGETVSRTERILNFYLCISNIPTNTGKESHVNHTLPLSDVTY